MSPASRVKPQTLLHLPRPRENPVYLAYVRKQPCCVTGQTWTVEAAHTGPRGLSQRANDLDAIPLIRKLHRAGYSNSYHTLGRAGFERFHGICIADIIQKLQTRASACGVSLDPAPRKKPMDRAGRRMGPKWRRA